MDWSVKLGLLIVAAFFAYVIKNFYLFARCVWPEIETDHIAPALNRQADRLSAFAANTRAKTTERDAEARKNYEEWRAKKNGRH